MNMTSLKQMAESKFDGVNKSVPMFKVNPLLLEFEEGFNARPIDRDHVNSFKAAYSSGADVPPLYVRVTESRIIVVEGHHRTVALRELIDEGMEIKAVDVIHFKGNDADRILLMINTSQGKPLTPLQAATQYAKLEKMGWAVQDIATKSGRTVAHIQQMMTLIGTNSDVQKMVERGEVAAHVAIKAARKHGDKAGEILGEALDKAQASGKKKITERAIKKVDEAKILTFVQGYVGRTLVPEWSDADYVAFIKAALEENFK